MEGALSCLRAVVNFITLSRLRPRPQVSVASLADQSAELDETFNYVHKLLKKMEEELPLEELSRTIRTIGHISYLGTPDVQKACAPCTAQLTALLTSQKTPDSLRQQIIMTISELCYLNKENQNVAVGIIDTLASYIGDCHKNTALCQWSCYAMVCITANNYEALKRAHHTPSMKKNIRKALQMSLNWDGWHVDYAQLIAAMLGVGMP